MNINIKMNTDFETALEEAKRKYGEDFEILNGIHESHTNFSDFIDGFIDKNVADVTIDANANASNKDIRSLLSEKGKSHDKLFAFNKIFYEIKKKYGLRTAREWLNTEYNGGFYLHDASTSTFMPYCFRGDTKILTDTGIHRLDELEGKLIKVLNKDHQWEDATVMYFGTAELRSVVLSKNNCEIVKTIYATGNHKWFAKDDEGTRIVDTDHLEEGMKIPFNTTNDWKDIEPSSFGVLHGFYNGSGNPEQFTKDTLQGEKLSLLPYFDTPVIGSDALTTEIIPAYFYDFPPLTASAEYLYGWLSGVFAAIGSIDCNKCKFLSKDIDLIKHVRNVLCVLGMPVDRLYYNMETEIYSTKIPRKYFKYDFFILPTHTSIAANEDEEYEEEDWKVESVTNTKIKDDVYCAVVPGTESFTLDNNVLTHNCFAYDLTRLATEGLFFLNHYNAEAPKHLTTFLDDVIEFISYMSNRTSGACGIPNVLVWTFYYWKRDCETGYVIKDPDYYVRQIFQKLIYRLNQPFMRIDQTAFVNVSIFDRNYVESLFGGLEFPDGTFFIDYVDEFIEHEKIFMEVVSEIRSTNMFTFPVLTYSLLYKDGKFVDEDFARWCSDHNTLWNDSNFFVSGDVTTLSNCPMSGDTKILYYSERYDEYIISSIEELYKMTHDYSSAHVLRDVRVLSNGGEVYCKVNKFDIPIEYEIILTNGASLKTTANHLNKVRGKDYVQTKDLTEDDYLPFDLKALEYNDELSYEDDGLVENGCVWIKIKEIRKLQNAGDVSYCMEVLNSNVEPVFTLANGIVTHNCRLLSDTTKLSGFINSIGGTALSIGSVKVNTINLMRIAYESLDTEDKEATYLKLLRERTELCCKTLDIIRSIIKRNVEKGLLPNYCDGGIEMDKQYCTIGILGLYEVIEAFGYLKTDEFGYVYYTDEGIKFASKIFEVLNDVKDSFTDEFSFNIESVPAERAAVILCQKDNLLYEKNEKFIYSNQWIPLSTKCTLQEKLRTAAILDNKCSGGAIAHINLESNFPNTDAAWDNLNKIAQSGVIYFAYNTRINECVNHHGFVGTDHCPVCGEEVYDTYQRIVGYLVPTRAYSKDRFREFNTRKWYDYAEMLKE
jgi:anaerobic ribonucleoside-triphosphate reductase